MATEIHVTAVVEAGAQLGENVIVMAHAVVTRHARLGDGVIVHPGAVVGGDPQYLKFNSATPSWVMVGAGSVLRENVTINRSIHADQATVVGARCFFMANSHAGHDCVVADDVVLANNAMLAGHVAVGAGTFVGGGAGIHQYCRIGAGAMVAGLARITRDVPPHTMVAERDELIGLNLVGLKRKGWPRETIMEIKAVYRAVCYAANPLKAAAEHEEGEIATSVEGRAFLAFFAEGKRGFARPNRAEATSHE